MKILNLIFLALILLFISCEDERSSMEELDHLIGLRAQQKVDVCHYSADTDSWQIINISINAWPAHESHGDVLLVDLDGDGFVEYENACIAGGDCDDNNPLIYPGAIEDCTDGFDNDCDGLVDCMDSDCDQDQACMDCMCLVDQFTMTFSNYFSYSSVPTEVGSTYALEVSGTYSYGGVWNPDCLDAAYRWCGGNPPLAYPIPFEAHPQRWKWNGTDDARPDNDVYNPSHIYEWTFQGDGNSQVFTFNDGYYGDNRGSLIFRLYKLQSCNDPC